MVSRAPSGRSPSSSRPIKWRRPSPSSPFASTPQPSPSHRLPRATSSFLLVVPVPATPPHRPELRRTLPPPPSGSQPSPLPWPRLCFARGKPKHRERRLPVAPPRTASRLVASRAADVAASSRSRCCLLPRPSLVFTGTPPPRRRSAVSRHRLPPAIVPAKAIAVIKVACVIKVVRPVIVVATPSSSSPRTRVAAEVPVEVVIPESLPRSSSSRSWSFPRLVAWW